MKSSIDQLYSDAKTVLMRLRPGEIHRTTPRATMVEVAIDILGVEVDADPERILSLLCQLYPIHQAQGRTKPKQLVETGRPFKYDRMMRIAADRSESQPTQIGLGKSIAKRFD
jgi:hypothetical protein